MCELGGVSEGQFGDPGLEQEGGDVEGGAFLGIEFGGVLDGLHDRERRGGGDLGEDSVVVYRFRILFKFCMKFYLRSQGDSGAKFGTKTCPQKLSRHTAESPWQNRLEAKPQLSVIRVPCPIGVVTQSQQIGKPGHARVGVLVVDRVGIVPSGGPNAGRREGLGFALAQLRLRGNLRSAVRLMVEIAGE